MYSRASAIRWRALARESDDMADQHGMTDKEWEGLQVIGEIIVSLENLLDIAKVAMPPELFAIDPRVIRAQVVLAKMLGEVQ